MVSAKLQRLPWSSRKEIRKSGSLRRSEQMWMKEPRPELNYLIQNLKGPVNESKRIMTSRIRKLKRIPGETRKLSLAN